MEQAVKELSGMSAGQGKGVPAVRVTPAECYTVRNGFYWAHIFVRAGQTDDRYWANIAVVSDFGSFGYCWTHMGVPWREFLPRLNFDYAMGKFFGRRFYEPMSLDECQEKARKLILDWRRTEQMSKSDARDLWDALPYCDGGPNFLSDLDRMSDGAMYRNELWDARWERPSTEARGFWNNIWPDFLAAIATETRRAETGNTGSVEDEGAGRNGIAKRIDHD